MSGLKSDDCPENPVVGSVNLCDGTGEVNFAYYDYNPHLWVCGLFVALFAITTLVHFAQAIIRKRWYLLATVFLCGVGETLGWAGRTWSSRSVEWLPSFGGYWYSSRTAFMLQIATLIISPAFLAACWYITLGKLMAVLGPQYSRFNTRTYAVIFVCGDVLSLVVQALGGAIAAGADTLEAANHGSDVMVIGVIIQVVIMVVYTLLLFDFVVAYLRKSPVKQLRLRKTQAIASIPAGSLDYHVEHKARLLILALGMSTLLVFIRSIYRTIELLDGWHGKIIRNETLFCVLDALCVFLAMAVLNLVNPGWFLPASNLQSQASSDHELDKLAENPTRKS